MRFIFTVDLLHLSHCLVIFDLKCQSYRASEIRICVRSALSNLFQQVYYLYNYDLSYWLCSEPIINNWNSTGCQHFKAIFLEFKMAGLWRRYLHLLNVHPFKVQVASAGKPFKIFFSWTLWFSSTRKFFTSNETNVVLDGRKRNLNRQASNRNRQLTTRNRLRAVLQLVPPTYGLIQCLPSSQKVKENNNFNNTLKENDEL